MKYCHKCGTIWEGSGQPGIRETCGKCSEDLHLCLNCRFYDEHQSNECQIDNLDPVIDKNKANHCDEFQFADRTAPEKDSNKINKAREQWKKIFGQSKQ